MPPTNDQFFNALMLLERCDPGGWDGSRHGDPDWYVDNGYAAEDPDRIYHAHRLTKRGRAALDGLLQCDDAETRAALIILLSN